jgi:hypothetical protein
VGCGAFLGGSSYAFSIGELLVADSAVFPVNFTGSTALATKSVTLRGYSVAAAGAALVYFRDSASTTTTATVLATVRLGAAGSQTEDFEVKARNGIYVHVSSGTLDTCVGFVGP